MTQKLYTHERYTHEQIRNWFKTWLIKVKDDEASKFFTINGITYEFCYYFRMFFKIHGIYRDITNDCVIWFIYENDTFTDEQFLSAPRFKIPSDLTTYVVNTFYEQWNR